MKFEKIVRAKNGKEVVLRVPQKKDLEEMLRYANELSREDTYLTLSGEVITKDEEKNYLNQILSEIKIGNRFQILGFNDNHLIANADIHRVTQFRRRSTHVGEISISVAKDWRGKGLGRILLDELIKGSQDLGVRMLSLDVYSENLLGLKLYESLGFEKAGIIPGAVWYKGKYIDLVTMYRKL